VAIKKSELYSTLWKSCDDLGSFGIVLLIWVLFSNNSSSIAQPTHSLYLDGKAAFVELPQNLTAEIESSTVEMWVKWESYKKWSRVFDFGRQGNAAVIQNEKSTATVNFVIWDQYGKRHRIRSKKAISTQKWHHIAAVSGSQGMMFYIDGNLVGKDSFDQSLKVVSWGSNFVGKSNWATDELFHGYMSEFRVWKTAKTKNEIVRNMYTQLKGNEDGLLGYWRFDTLPERYGRILDLTGNGYDAYLIGDAKIVALSEPRLNLKKEIANDNLANNPKDASLILGRDIIVEGKIEKVDRNFATSKPAELTLVNGANRLILSIYGSDLKKFPKNIPKYKGRQVYAIGKLFKTWENEIRMRLSNPEQISFEQPAQPDTVEILEVVPIYALANPPEIKKQVKPKLSLSQKFVGVNQRVIISYIIKKDGSVANIRPMIGNFPFIDLASEAIRQYQFMSGTYEGEPVNVSVTEVMAFEAGGIASKLFNKAKPTTFSK
jgi:hypothetical protein